MKCSDCGAINYQVPWGWNRADICPECKELREQVFTAMGAGKVELGTFQKLQKTIANSYGSGRGAQAMRKALGSEAA